MLGTLIIRTIKIINFVFISNDFFNTTSGGRNDPYAFVDHICNVRSHANCLLRHPISESL
jgi:hypothetical protein